MSILCSRLDPTNNISTCLRKRIHITYFSTQHGCQRKFRNTPVSSYSNYDCWFVVGNKLLHIVNEPISHVFTFRLRFLCRRKSGSNAARQRPAIASNQQRRWCTCLAVLLRAVVVNSGFAVTLSGDSVTAGFNVWLSSCSKLQLGETECNSAIGWEKQHDDSSEIYI